MVRIGQCSIDLTGKRIGYLKVIRWSNKGEKGNTLWWCECDCGAKLELARSKLTSKTKERKNCGNCIKGKAVLGNTYRTFKIIGFEEGKRKGISTGFYIGECNICGHQKKISKWMIKNDHKAKRKRNLNCPICFIKLRQGGNLKVGDQNGFLRIIAPLDARGKGMLRKFYWKVECLYKGLDCKGIVEYSTTAFRANKSCGCKRGKEELSIKGLSSQKHQHYKIYALLKQVYDRCHREKHKHYSGYGGRGIYLCEEWRQDRRGKQALFDFVDWCLKNGWEEGLHLDRIDNDGPYAPWNCQFITAIENIFYASIDNATKDTLKTYERYSLVWEQALCILKKNGELVQKDFLQLVKRWKSRIRLRKNKLKSLRKLACYYI